MDPRDALLLGERRRRRGIQDAVDAETCLEERVELLAQRPAGRFP
jgi:hypothetical protein